MRATACFAVAIALGAAIVVQPASAAGTASPAGVTIEKAAAVDTPPASPAPATQEPLPPQTYSYDPAHRRDPFVSLLRRGSDTEASGVGGVRPGGLMGLSAGEVTLKGVLASRGGFVGILRGADNKTYIVHPGDKLLDGTIRSIAAESMVILQQVNDPLSQQKEREVRKELRQTEEAK
jgi:Tfp pilus assembly protein PilP